jgi:hypothetical protein
MSSLPETIKIQIKEQRKQEVKRNEEDQINENTRKFYEMKKRTGLHRYQRFLGAR